MRRENERKDTNKTILLLIVGLLIVNLFGGWTAVREWLITQQTIREVNYGYAVMTSTPESWFGTAVPEQPPAAPGLVIIEEPAVVIATGEPPVHPNSVPVVAPTLPQDTTNQAAAVYAADPERAQACMDAAVTNRRSSPACTEKLNALGGGR